MTIYWTTAMGQVFDIAEMETDHLFYTIRLVWNNIHTGCKEIETGGLKRKLSLPTSELEKYLTGMLTEAQLREDLHKDQKALLFKMLLLKET